MEKAIEIKNLFKSFKGVEVLKGVNLEAEKGKILGLLGPNGAGKTTIIRILSTLLGNFSGTATVDGHDVKNDPQSVRKSIGLTGQYAAVDEYLTGHENLEMIGRLYHMSRKCARQRADELLERFDLVAAKDRPVKTYSGGMRRRLDLALSLISTPPVIFLDEPTTGLDPSSRLTMWGIIEDLSKAGATVLLTTQYLDEADRLANKIAVLDEGKIIAQGTADELKRIAGKERLIMTLTDEGDFTNIAASLKGEEVQANPETLTISMATGGSAAEIMRAFDHVTQAGGVVDTMTLQKPTLDDVFFNLTGRKAASENEEKPKL